MNRSHHEYLQQILKFSDAEDCIRQKKIIDLVIVSQTATPWFIVVTRFVFSSSMSRSLLGNKKNQDHNQMNDYEKIRLLRVQENQERLKDLGVNRIANSLTSLVESKKTKKKMVKPTQTNAEDVEYIPPMSDDDIEKDYQEFAASVEISNSKKQHHPQYIAPQSMNKLANFAKRHRVNAPNTSHKLATKENQSKARITMGELISSTKGIHKQNEVFKQVVAKPNCITRKRAKRRLVLIDEDDEKDDERFPIINGVIFTNDEDDVDQDDEFENMGKMTFENNDEDLQEDDSHDDLENEDDVLVQELLQGREREKTKDTLKFKKRGPTMMHLVHMRKFNEREVIICNEFGQPIGPVTKEKDIAAQFYRFLGTIARNHSYASLVHSSWHKVPHKEKIWDYVLEKYDVPDAARTWVLMTIGNAYKVHKCRFKKKHFYQYKDNKTRWRNRPKNILEDDFSRLLSLWNNKKTANRCLRAKETRMSQKNMHTAGPKSFARIRDEMEAPTLTQVFERTRKRTEGRSYVHTYDNTSRKIEQMRNYKPSEDESALVDPFIGVMNKEKHGYRRLYGRRVTNKLIKKLDGGDTSLMVPGGFMESLKASVEVEKKNNCLNNEKKLKRTLKEKKLS
ncbi:hypothetical protein R6Q59_033533 [Mikania micrantha]